VYLCAREKESVGVAVVSGSWQDRPITISVKPNCLTASIEQRQNEPNVYSYDYAARKEPRLAQAGIFAEGRHTAYQLL
jgi:hypothetical protein